MRITGLQLENYRQFRELELSFVDAQGNPLEKICFIGTNGTGKSTLLKLLASLSGFSEANPPNRDKKSQMVAWLTGAEQQWGEVNFNAVGAPVGKPGFSIPGKEPIFAERGLSVSSREEEAIRRISRGTPIVFCPPEADVSRWPIPDVPLSMLANALNQQSGQSKSHHHLVSQATVNDFWTLLIGRIKQRESDFQLALKLERNRSRTIEEVEREFDADHPQMLHTLGQLWNRLLSRAGLEFDVEGASIPVQLTDNLKAYIRLSKDHRPIPYDELSTGIRNFIFRLGHLQAIFFDKPEEDSLLFVDEPEASLHPDFLYDLVEIYRSVAPRAQMFFATHSPIIAAQFRPEERVILEFNEDGFVVARPGVSPEGDDPNDLLKRDFEVRNLYGKPGLKKWERFRELSELMVKEPDSSKRRALAQEYLEIGREYDFAELHEIPA